VVSLAGSRGTARWSCALSVTVENGVLLTVVVRTDLAGSNHDDEATRLGSLRVEWLRQMPTWSRRGSTCSPLADGASPCVLARLTTMCSVTARDHCPMGFKSVSWGLESVPPAVKPGSGPLNQSGPTAVLGGRQHFCTSEDIRPVRLQQINFGAAAIR
jgi:hypothetical protein